MNKQRSRGRPSAPTGARDAILTAARRRFETQGYQVPLRLVAADAGVDPALISYYFGSKRGLFGASMELPSNPPQILADAIAGPLDTLPERVLRRVIAAWEDPVHGAALRAFASAAATDVEAARLFSEMAEREIVARLAERLGGTDASSRAAVAASQIAGLVFARYVLRTEPLASMNIDELAARLVPPLRAALSAPVRKLTWSIL